MELSKNQNEKIKHMLGLTYKRKPYRNYYCSGDKDNDFEKLIEIGFAISRERSMDMGGVYYFLTDKGLDYVIENHVFFNLDRRLIKMSGQRMKEKYEL